MNITCTRPYCQHPINSFKELKDTSILKTVQQKYCISCGMPLILAGRYLPKKLLGKGGFGAAYLAVDRYSPTMRKCVVKQFQPEGNMGEAELAVALELFEREALVLDDLGNRHPQIPDLFAYFPLLVPGTINGRKQGEEQYFYLVQEYIDGQDLEQELLQKGAFSEQEVTDILREVLNILTFVHENGSIHRDIKPSNIMRNREGVFYLLDFGAVKMATNHTPNPQLKSTGIYSMGFAPPEQMAGAQVFPSTDLYALAVTCVNLLTAQPTTDLYDAYSNTWQWRKYVTVGDRLGLTLEKMLQHNPAKRFQSARDALKIIDPPQLRGANAPSVTPQPAIKAPISRNTTPPLSDPEPMKIEPINPTQEGIKPVEKPSKPVKEKKNRAPLPVASILTGVSFWAFEGVLGAIAITSALSTFSMGIQMGVLGGIMGLLILILWKKVIEKWDLLLVGGATMALVYFLPLLHNSLFTIFDLPLLAVLIAPPVVALVTLFIASIFLLILSFLRNLF
ncbi:protein kinase [Cyanobacterium stanieri LEGE 03274]|uniref:non-specific serine/threonine protein kinase n=1 Tax=Cyanobacterium stanieri LEGE 03274 TaxID=1828756 RepID=A0ABR9V4M4_9CHRO|nr:serine/threonine-protein kinase [Cyanobacterium stanieri]MBE9222833.1 protein kinase [Cyanobacterium stanieri LEGE 03274]